MNPIAYNLKPDAILRFLLVGKDVYSLDGKEPQRIWILNVYHSTQSRKIAESKMKRGYTDIIFIEWDVTMEQIVKQGEYVTILAPENVPRSDEDNIIDQLWREKLKEH